jgi:hypothetical protein
MARSSDIPEQLVTIDELVMRSGYLPEVVRSKIRDSELTEKWAPR